MQWGIQRRRLGATGVQYGTLDLYPPTQMIQVPLPDGDAGIALTIQFMEEAARHGQQDPQIRQLALDILNKAGVANKDTQGEINALYDWVKSNIAFRGELDETVQAPEVTVKFGAGDCDDHSVLVAALAGATGFGWQFKTVATSGQDFQHVYAQIFDNSGNWVSDYHPVSMDTTVDEAQPGWEPTGVSRAATWRNGERMSGLRVRRMRGLGWYGQPLSGLGDDTSGDGSGGASVSDQISQVLIAGTPLAQDIIQGMNQPSYYQPAFPGSPYSPYATGPQGNYPAYRDPQAYSVPITQRPWFWPAVFGVGLFALFKMGENRGLRR